MEEQKAILSRFNRQLPDFYFFILFWKAQIIFSKGSHILKNLDKEEWKSWSENAIYLIDLEKSIYICCVTFKPNCQAPDI